MQLKEIIIQTKPSDIISDAFDEGTLDDMDLCVYAGLDDAGFARKRQCILNKYELERRAADADVDVPDTDYSNGKFDWDEVAQYQYVDYEMDSLHNYHFYEVMDNGNLIGYYLLCNPLPINIVSKAFLYADEAGTDDQTRIMFMLLNRLSEAKQRHNEIEKENGYDPSKTLAENAPLEFADAGTRVASGSARPKKAGYFVRGSRLDKFIAEHGDKIRTEARQMRTASSGNAGQEIVIQCPDGMTLE